METKRPGLLPGRFYVFKNPLLGKCDTWFLCNRKGVFPVISREELLAYADERFCVAPDYPWAKTPSYAILRHSNNKKWFAAIVSVTPDKLQLSGKNLMDVLLLKCDPILSGSLRKDAGILPAYHMNKEHWITVLLDGSCPKEKIFSLIDLSYDLTK